MKKLIIAAIAASSIAAHASFMDGNKLLSRLEEGGYAEGVAMGYVMGVADAGESAVHCPPGNVTAGQLRDMAKVYLRETPEIRAYGAEVIILNMLKRVWPCAKKGSAL